MALTVMAVIPAIVLWRIERRIPVDDTAEALAENAVVEVLA
jgi:hypothetical protein